MAPPATLSVLPPRPALRRRSQSEQPLTSNKSSLRTVTWVDEKENNHTGGRNKTGAKLHHEDSHYRRPTTTPPRDRVVSVKKDLSESSHLSDEATVLNSLCSSPQPAAKASGKRVLFSTPAVPINTPKTEVLYATPVPVPRGSCYKALLNEPVGHMNSLPFTPSNFNSNNGFSTPPPMFGAPLNGFCNTPVQNRLINPGTVFPSVVAASEALRINLGLDALMTPPLSRRPSLQAVPMAQNSISSPKISKPAPGPMADTKTQLLASLYPAPGQTQPAACQTANLPPIVNTGASGPMKVQPGDWSCLVCSFVNWRRRKYCMRCCPYSEGNASSALLSPTQTVSTPTISPLYAPGLFTPLPPNAAMQPMHSIYGTPPRHALRQQNIFASQQQQQMSASGLFPGLPFPLHGLLPPMTSPARNTGGLINQLQLPPLPFLPGSAINGQAALNNMASLSLAAAMPLLPACLPLIPLPLPLGMTMPSPLVTTTTTQATLVERPLTPSPTNSDASGCSFAFSNVSTHSPTVSSVTASPPTPACEDMGFETLKPEKQDEHHEIVTSNLVGTHLDEHAVKA